MKKYIDIYEKLKNQIIDGSISFKKKIPSKRITAENFGVSIITVEHAYELLLSEGYIVSKERSGYFANYSENSFYFAEKIEFTPFEIVNNAKKNEGISFSELSKKTRYVLSEYGEQLLNKSPNFGCEFLKNAIKKYLKRNKGINININQIYIGSGAEYLYGLIIDFFSKNKIFGIENPTYNQIENIYKIKEVKTELLSLEKDGISSNALANSNAQILHVTPYKNYPTGISATVSKKAEYLKWASEKDRFIIEDDYESEFSLSGKISQTIFSMDKNDSVIYINSFTKTICRGLRVGYMILPKKLVNLFNDKFGTLSCTVPTLEQYLIATILEDGTFERHINKIRRLRRKEL